MVTILGQSSQITSANSSAASFSFLRPTVLSVQPRSFGTLPGSQEITVRGIALGVDDLLASTAIVFGNAADNTRSGLIVPTSAVLLPGGQQQLTFRLPEGVGPNRAVSVAVYPRGMVASAATLTFSDPIADSGLAPTDTDVPPVLVTPLGLGSFFSFLPPSISSIIASSPRSAVDASFLAASAGCTSVSGVNATFCGYLKLEIAGSNFGPSTATGPPDSVLRSLLVQDVAQTLPPSPFPSAVRVASWTQALIVAYTTFPSMYISVSITTQSVRAAPQAAVSNAILYSTLAPMVLSMTGPTTDIQTSGAAAPNFIVMNVAGLDPNKKLRVTLGDREAPVFTRFGVGPLSNAQAASTLVRADGTATLYVLAPPGQGCDVALVVSRFDGSAWSSSSASDDSAFVCFAAPNILSAGVQLSRGNSGGANAANYDLQAAVSGLHVAGPTDGSLLLLLTGTNLGTCPLVSIGPVVLRFCADAQGAATPGANRTHSAIFFPIPQGEGENWPVQVDVGGQQPPQLLFFDFSAPTITSASPFGGVSGEASGLTTAGGNRVLFNGTNFGAPFGGSLGGGGATSPFVTLGFKASAADPTPPAVFLGLFAPGAAARAAGSAAPDLFIRGDGFVACLDVVRHSHSSLSCVLPEGDGAGLAVGITRAFDGGETQLPGAFSYDAPVVLSVSSSATSAPMTARDALGRLLAGGPTSGGFTLTLTGLNFGVGLRGFADPRLSGATGAALLAADASGLRARYCAFMAWPSAPTLAGLSPSALAAQLVCDAMLGFWGEGELPAASLLALSHASATIAVPEGLGSSLLVISSAGGRNAGSGAVSFRYDAPNITSMLPARVGTEGGTRVTITGANFGPAPLDVRAAGLVFPGPVLSPLSGAPKAALLVQFHRVCLADAVDAASGAPPPGLAGCAYSIVSHSHTQLVLLSAPGIGLNHTVVVRVLEDAFAGAAAAAAAAADAGASAAPWPFDYLPPEITSFAPSPLLVDAEPWAAADRSTADFAPFALGLDVFGTDFGNAELADVQGWSAVERAIAMAIGGVPCLGGGPLRRRGPVNARQDVSTIVSCLVDWRALPAGVSNVSLTIAGQTALSGANATSGDAFGVFVLACKQGSYAHVGEPCLPCPAQYPDTPALTGAACDGYDARSAAGAQLPPRPPLPFEARFPYPRPLKGWYNLNSSDANTLKWGSWGGADPAASQMLACPDGFRDHGRDVCLAPCDPPESCLGNNLCAPGYASKPPLWKCAGCDAGFYRRNGECVKCPDSPWALVIGFTLLVAVAGGLGYFLNQKGVNIAVVSIGLDFFQVLAIFATSGVKWPAVIQQLFQILSAFNLNIEIVAPDCIVPDLSYKAKFWFIMLLPLSVGALLGLIFVLIWAWKAIIMGQAKRDWFTHKPALIASTMALVYILYLYLTRTIFDVFNCTPTFPPDGRLYLGVANNEQCGIPGGTQLTLLPYAVAAIIIYCLGYPAFVFYVLHSNKEKVMLDQLLKAKGVGDDRLTNPIAFDLRMTFGRSYFQFKPDYCFWILAIILRKFFIAITGAVFGKNSSFQMAACLLIMFLAYSAQMMFRPYMNAGEFEEVLRSHLESSFTNAMHARIRAQIANVEARGKKRVRKNLLNFEGKVDRSAVLGLLTSWLFNYNTIEQLMLFAAVIVCLMGIMYQANSSSSFYPGALDGVTAVVMIDIILAIIYYFTMLFSEMAILYNEDNKRKQLERAAKSRGGAAVAAAAGGGKEAAAADGSAAPKHGAGRLVGDDGELQLGRVEQQSNPLFLAMAVGGAGRGAPSALSGPASSLSAEALERQVDLPSPELWRVYRAEFLLMQQTLAAAQASVAEAKRAAAVSAAEAAEGGGGGGGGGGKAAAFRLARPVKAEFRPVGASASSGGARAASPSAKSLKALRSATATE